MRRPPLRLLRPSSLLRWRRSTRNSAMIAQPPLCSHAAFIFFTCLISLVPNLRFRPPSSYRYLAALMASSTSLWVFCSIFLPFLFSGPPHRYPLSLSCLFLCPIHRLHAPHPYTPRSPPSLLYRSISFGWSRLRAPGTLHLFSFCCSLSTSKYRIECFLVSSGSQDERVAREAHV